ncbi:MAG: Tol-Pal system beta propeller repeat protein TolB [Pseudomonadota bacterium]
MWRVIFVALYMLAATPAVATLNIEITRSAEGAARIAVVPFGWYGQGAAPVDVAAVIAADLHRSGLFSPVVVKDMLEKPDDAAAVDFKNWRVIEVPNLVVGRLYNVGPDKTGEDIYTLRFHLFDVYQAKVLQEMTLQGRKKELRYRAHQISDLIYQILTGQRGAFTTRIAYITKGLNVKGGGRYTLFVADADTENALPVFVSPEPIFSPAWAPDGKRIAYVTMEKRRQQVYVQDTTTGQRDLVANFMNYNGAPAWSPDGKKLALALSQDGNHEVYVLDIETRVLKRITNHWGIDTEPAWTPDGRNLVYTSEQGGSPQIYQYTFSSGEIKRLTFEGKQNLRASYSPDGRLLTFIHRTEDRQDHVAVMDVATGLVRVLTDTGLDESPSFAPNGSMIIFATTKIDERHQRGVLSAVSVDGRVQQMFSLPPGAGDVREPTWAPFGH